VRLSQGRGGTQRRTAWRNDVVPRGSSIGMPGYLEAYRDPMAVVAELADALHAARSTVILSGYDSPLYDELYDGWQRITFPATTNGAPTESVAAAPKSSGPTVGSASRLCSTSASMAPGPHSGT